MVNPYPTSSSSDSRRTRSEVLTLQFWLIQLPRERQRSRPKCGPGYAADGMTCAFVSSALASDVKEGNWIQTVPGKGRNTILRLY